MIKTYIKTAHGYISFQPSAKPDGPVDIQYRESPGLWEEITLETIGAPIPPPEPESPPPSVDENGIPASVQPVERTPAYIGRCKAHLQSQGYNLLGPCGAFAIVEHAVWWLAPTNPTVGLLDKPDGNMCRSYATDIIFFRDQRGAIVDVLGDGGNANNPQWNVSSPGEAELDRWRPPVVPASKSAQAASVARGYTNAWADYSKARLARCPICVHCGAPATMTNHIQGARAHPERFWDPSNHESVCAACNSRQNIAREGGFGRWSR